MNEKYHVITCEKNWMEHTAIAQLASITKLRGVERAVGLPDLHAGKSPVGIAVLTQGVIYPHLIGNDIGCGMGLYKTGVPLAKYRADRWVTRLNNIRALEDLPTDNPYDETSPIYDIGTIGSGNHFAEFQRVEEIVDEGIAQELNLQKDEVLLLVHSGSRGYGERILRKYLDFDGLELAAGKAQDYLAEHEDALLWAERNRYLAGSKLIKHLGFDKDLETVIDCHHNFAEQTEYGMLHRKGALSARRGAVVIPGSRGSMSYVVMPTENTEASLWSLSHGAGRKWARSLCKSRIRDKYDRDSIRETKLKSRVVCHDTQLLYQEAPEAYKNIEHIISALLEHGLIHIVATLRPLLTFKG